MRELEEKSKLDMERSESYLCTKFLVHSHRFQEVEMDLNAGDIQWLNITCDL